MPMLRAYISRIMLDVVIKPFKVPLQRSIAWIIFRPAFDN